MSQIQELHEFLKVLTAETDRKFRELSDSQKELSEEQRIRSAELDRKFAETDRELKELAAETNREFKELGRYVKELSRNINGIAESNGRSAEQYFSSALQNSLSLNGITFEAASTNVNKYLKSIEIREEDDVILTNPDAVGIVEIKSRLRKEHVETLAGRKVENFRKLYPEDSSKAIYLAAAGLSVDPDAIERGRELGVYIITQQGEGIKILNDAVKPY